MTLNKLVISALLLASSSCAAPNQQPTVTARVPCHRETQIYHGTEFTYCREDNSDDLQDHLELIGRIKRYEQEHLLIPATPNYLEYHSERMGDAQTIYILYVTPPDMIPDRNEPRVNMTRAGNHRCPQEDAACMMWNRNVDALEDEEEFYKDRGYDTYRRVVANFGSGSDLNDQLLEYDLAWRVSVVFHEDFHFARIGEDRDWDPWVEESLASAFGLVAAEEFLREHPGYGDHDDAEENLEARTRFSRRLNTSHDALVRLYASHGNPRRTRERREEIIGRMRSRTGERMNNASIWGTHPYTYLYQQAREIRTQVSSTEEFARILLAAPNERRAALSYLARHAGNRLERGRLDDESGFDVREQGIDDMPILFGPEDDE